MKIYLKETFIFYLPLVLVFLFCIFGPEAFSNIIFGESIGEVSYLRYIGRDIDFYLRKNEFFSITSIWYIVPMESVLLWIQEYVLLGMFFIMSCLLLIRYFVVEGVLTEEKIGLKSTWQSFYYGLIVVLLLAIILFVVEVSVDVIKQYDFIENMIVLPSEDREESLFMRHPIYFLFVVIVKCILGPCFEELIFRGILYSRTRQYIKSPFVSIAFSVLFNSIIFAYLHYLIVGYMFEDLYLPVICGVISCLLFEKTKSLLPSVMFHISGNLFIFCAPIFYH